MINLLTHIRIKFINDDGTPTKDFYDFLRELNATQIPVGGIIAILSNTPPTGYLATGATYSRTQYPKLYDVLGTETIPSVSDGMYLADAGASAVGSYFGNNTLGLLHTHAYAIVASGTGATVSGANQGNMATVDNRPRTLGVRFYVRAE